MHTTGEGVYNRSSFRERGIYPSVGMYRKEKVHGGPFRGTRIYPSVGVYRKEKVHGGPI